MFFILLNNHSRIETYNKAPFFAPGLIPGPAAPGLSLLSGPAAPGINYDKIPVRTGLLDYLQAPGPL